MIIFHLPIGRPRRSLFWHILFCWWGNNLFWNGLFPLSLHAAHAKEYTYFQEKYTNNDMNELNFISFYFMRSKKTTMLTTAEWNPFIHSFIHWLQRFMLFVHFDFHLCVFNSSVVAVLNFSWNFSYTMYTIRATIVRKCFSKQIENKLKNSLCIFSILFHSRFWFDFNSTKRQKSKWLSCRIRCGFSGFSNCAALSSSILKRQNRQQIQI